MSEEDLCSVLGFVWTKLGFPAPPLLLDFVPGPMMEEHLRRAMLMAKGDPTVFVTRPISLAFLIITALIMVVMVAPAVKKRRGDIAG
jgi:TctA family transporter